MTFKFKRLSSGRILAIDPYPGFWAIISDENERFEEVKREYTKVKLSLEKVRALEERKVQITHVEMHLTENCNMDCAYCYVQPLLQKPNKMNVETAKSILSKVIHYAEEEQLPWVTVTFHGGEPLLCKSEILDIIMYFSKEKRLKFDIQTNGTLLDEEFCREMMKYQVKIGFSLDGPKIINDRLRKFKNHEGSFEKIMKGISVYKEYNKKFGMICTVHKYNVNFLGEMISFFHEIGAHSLFLNPLIPYSEETMELVPENSVLINNYKSAILRQININKDNDPDGGIFISNIEALLLNIVADYQPCVCYESPCGAGRIMIVVTSNGDVYPCSEFITSKEFCIGNLINEDITKILNSDLCQLLRRRSVRAIPKCKECLYRYICCGNCPYSSYFSNGTFFSPPLYCEFYHEIIVFLFELLGEYGKDLLALLISDSEKLKDLEVYYELI